MLSLHEIVVLTDFRTFAKCSVLFDKQVETLKEKGLIELDSLRQRYVITPKGDAMLDLLETTSLPIQSWIDPRGTK